MEWDGMGWDSSIRFQITEEAKVQPGWAKRSHDHRNNRQNAGSYLVSVKKLSPQNGGFTRAKLASPRTFCAKATGSF